MRGLLSEDERMSQRPPVAGHRLIRSERATEKSRLRTPSVDGVRLLPCLGAPPEEGHLLSPRIRRRGPDARLSVPEPAGRDERGAPLCSRPPEVAAERGPRSAGRRDPAVGGAGRWTAS